MLALGIDPGTAICGYGFVEQVGSRLVPRAYGAITTSPKMPMEERLMKLYDELDALIKENRPDVMGVEQLFFNRNITNVQKELSSQSFSIEAKNLSASLNKYVHKQGYKSSENLYRDKWEARAHSNNSY